jgi:hypothetical protein
MTGLNHPRLASYHDPESEPPESQLPPSLPPLSHDPESEPPLSHEPESDPPQSQESEPESSLPLSHQPPLLSLLESVLPPEKPPTPPLDTVTKKPMTRRMIPARYHQRGSSRPGES